MLLISLLPVLLLLLFRGNDHCHTYHSLFNLISTSDCETWQESALAVAWSSTDKPSFSIKRGLCNSF